MRVPTLMPGFDTGTSLVVEGDAVLAMVDGWGWLPDDSTIDSNLQQYVELVFTHC